MNKDAVASQWFSSVKRHTQRGIKTALVGKAASGLLPVLVLFFVFESGFAFMVSVTGTGYSHRYSEADVLLETLSLSPAHTKRHT